MLWVFSCLCLVYWFVHAFVHQNVNDFIHKIQKITFTDSFGNYLSITYRFGKLAIWQASFRKKTRLSHTCMNSSSPRDSFTLCLYFHALMSWPHTYGQHVLIISKILTMTVSGC